MNLRLYNIYLFNYVTILKVIVFDVYFNICFFLKEDKYVFKAYNSCCVGGIFKSLNTYFLPFSKKLDDLYLYK